MKVWIVTHGCYSDENVRGVFSSQSKAMAYIEMFANASRKEFNVYEDFELDDPDHDWVRSQGLKAFHVKINDQEATATPTDDTPNEEVTCYQLSGYTHAGTAAPPPEERLLYTDVWARDEEHAIKIASERRAAWLVRYVPPPPAPLPRWSVLFTGTRVLVDPTKKEPTHGFRQAFGEEDKPPQDRIVDTVVAAKDETDAVEVASKMRQEWIARGGT